MAQHTNYETLVQVIPMTKGNIMQTLHSQHTVILTCLLVMRSLLVSMTILEQYIWVCNQTDKGYIITLTISTNYKSSVCPKLYIHCYTSLLGNLCIRIQVTIELNFAINTIS